MALYYVDTSAVVKTILEEPESTELARFISGADLCSCELLLTEVPRACRRSAKAVGGAALRSLLEQAAAQLATIGLLPLDQEVLSQAGGLVEPALRSLDAIHVAAAVRLSPLDGFVTYDERQAAAARLAGLRTYSPGV